MNNDFLKSVNPVKIDVHFEDGSTVTAEDFVAVINNPECDAQMFFNADAVTLGQAIQMISFAYTEQLAEMPEDQANLVREALQNMIAMEGKVHE